MASIFTERYANFDLTTGADDGTSEANAWKTVASAQAGIVAGNRINVKRQASPYNATANVTFSTAGTTTAPIYWRAYTSTIGDGGIWEIAYNNSGSTAFSWTGAYTMVEGVHFKAGAAVNENSFLVNGTNSMAYRCYSEARIGGGVANSITNARRCCFVCSGTSGTNAVVGLGGSNVCNSHFEDCLFRRTNNIAASYLVTSDQYDRTITMKGCVFIGGGNASETGMSFDRVTNGRGITIEGCRFYNLNNGLYFIDESTTDKNQNTIRRCLFDTMAGYAIKRNITSTGRMRIYDCYYRGCTSGFSNYMDSSDEAVFNVNALTADPFLDKSAINMEMNSTSGGGQTPRDAEYLIDIRGTLDMKYQPFGEWWRIPSSSSGTPAFAAVG